MSELSGWILYLKSVSSTDVTRSTQGHIHSLNSAATNQTTVRLLFYVAWLVFLFSIAPLTLPLYTVQKVHIKLSAAMTYQDIQDIVTGVLSC